jgi:broad specificity phosphatase PhoE
VEVGDVFCGELETSLSKIGWKQLKQAFGKTKPEWDAVVTSPKVQCSAFAEWYAEKHSLPLMVDERLREIHFGDWEGCSPQHILQTQPEKLAQWWANPVQAALVGGEDFDAFRSRVLDAWDDVQREWRGKRVLTVTHAGIIRVLVGHVLQMPDERLLSLNVEYGTLTHLRVLRDRSGEWASLLAHGC